MKFQANLMYVIKSSSNLVLKEYDKMIQFLEDKKRKRGKEKLISERSCITADR